MYQPLIVTWVRALLDDISTLFVRRNDVIFPIPVGYRRSVTTPPEAFARESFLDEYASLKGIDPVELRRDYLDSRAMAVVDKVTSMAGWGSPMPEGATRGIAHFAAWGITNVAQVAEITLINGEIKGTRVYCAVGCGIAINPDMIVAQMESGIVFGLTAALKENIRIQNGIAFPNNLQEYPLLRFDEMPQVQVEIIKSSDSPTGIGEMSNQVIAPAVANAIFALSGQRLRKMPYGSP